MSTTRPYSPGDRGPESGRRRRFRGAWGRRPGRPVPGGRQARRLSFDGESGVVPLARDFARQALHAWGWLPAESADRRAAARERPAGRLRTRHQRLPACRGPGRAPDLLRQQGVARRGLRPWRGPARPAHPAPRRPPRRPRHVHRAAAVSGLGSRAHSGGHRQDGVGGTRGARVAPPNPGCDSHLGLPAVRTLLRTWPNARRISSDPARTLSSLHKAPGRL